MNPYYQDDFVTIYHGDCLELKDALAFDVVVSDPPWGISVAVDNARFSGGNYMTKRTAVNERIPIRGDDVPFDPAPWINLPAILWGGHCFANCLPVSAGWLVWDKRKGLEDVAEKWPLSEAELAWTNVRGSIRVFRNRWMGLVRGEEIGEHYHPTQKPVTLMEWCLGFVPDGVVLDPYMGAGSTLRAAKNLGRRAIGIELEERYCEIAANRMRQEVLGLS